MRVYINKVLLLDDFTGYSVGVLNDGHAANGLCHAHAVKGVVGSDSRGGLHLADAVGHNIVAGRNGEDGYAAVIGSLLDGDAR